MVPGLRKIVLLICFPCCSCSCFCATFRKIQIIYTWPGSNWRPSACEADVIATRPQVREQYAHSSKSHCLRMNERNRNAWCMPLGQSPRQILRWIVRCSNGAQKTKGVEGQGTMWMSRIWKTILLTPFAKPWKGDANYIRGSVERKSGTWICFWQWMKSSRPCGLMDKACLCGFTSWPTEQDCRFESCQGRLWLLCLWMMNNK